MKSINYMKNRILNEKYKKDFLRKTRKLNLNILDVGCGNDSPKLVNEYNPKLKYFGLDIDDYYISEESKKLCHRYTITTSSEFPQSILEFNIKFDYIICAHNLEHTEQPYIVFENILKVLNKNGEAYFSFPSALTKNFQSRKGTLNFFDDPTHKEIINIDKLFEIIKNNNISITYFSNSYRPFFRRILGYFRERKSKRINHVLNGTWAYYGFETIIWLKKNN